MTIPVCPGRSPATCDGGTGRGTASCGPSPASDALDTAAGDGAARRAGRGPRRRLPDARHERPHVPRSRRWTFHPYGRRVLLTAYADTNAAIEAINVVDLDYYLLKPWDPPEEKLYPVLDEQIEAWRSSRAPGRRRKPRWWATAGLPGAPRSANSSPATSAYRWFQSDEPEGVGCSRLPGGCPRGARW